MSFLQKRGLILRTFSRHNQKTDTTAQLYCTLSTQVTPKTISRQNQKTNTTPKLYCTLSMQVCKTKTYFPPEPKTDTTAQLEKSSSSPRPAGVFVPLSVILSVCQGLREGYRVKECFIERQVIFLSACIEGILQLFTNFYLHRKFLIIFEKQSLL